MASPHPIPTPLKILRGHRPDRINKNEPKSTEADPTPPDHLDEVARQEWDRMVPVLQSMRVLTQADRQALALYCNLFSRYLAARAAIEREGLILQGTNNLWQNNPYVKIENDCIDKMIKVLMQFGMTPASRSRLSVGDGPEDGLSAFLSSKPKPKQRAKR